MTAQRYLDLHDVGGADDYFSSDLADDEMRKRFSAFGARGVGCLVAYSGADEYAPKSVDKPKLVEKICGACAAGNAARVAGLVVAGAVVRRRGGVRRGLRRVSDGRGRRGRVLRYT